MMVARYGKDGWKTSRDIPGEWNMKLESVKTNLSVWKSAKESSPAGGDRSRCMEDESVYAWQMEDEAVCQSQL